MRLTTTKQALVDCLGIVNKAVSSRSSIQVLSGVLIEAIDQGVILSATDREISVRGPLSASLLRGPFHREQGGVPRDRRPRGLLRLARRDAACPHRCVDPLRQGRR